jgi:hypothetical protein
MLSACAPPGSSTVGTASRLYCSDIHVDYHEVLVHTTEPLPAKVAVMVEGQLKYDMCLVQPVIMPPPLVSSTEQPGAIVVLVRHLGAYKKLPTEISFEILDRGDCTKPAVSFFKADNVPLEFKTEYPKGKACGASLAARVDLTK